THRAACAASPSSRSGGGRYRLSEVALSLSTHPPSTASLPRTNSGSPAAQVMASTLRIFAHDSLAQTLTTLPLALSSGLPPASSSGIGGRRSSTLAFGQGDLHGREMHERLRAEGHRASNVTADPGGGATVAGVGISSETSPKTLKLAPSSPR